LNIQNHIVFLCSRLDLPGGIERAVVNTANLFGRKGLKVSLVILDETDRSFYSIHPDIEIVQQSLSFGINIDGNIFSRKIKLIADTLKLKKIFKKLEPDFIICTEYPFSITAILSGAKKNSTVVSWEHHNFFELQKNFFWKRLFKTTYPKLNVVVCLNEDEKQLFQGMNSNIQVIPNFIETGLNPISKTKVHKNQTILTVARLTPVKGIDFILHIAEKILNNNPDWQWKIIGNGEMEERILHFIKDKKLQNRMMIQHPFDHNILHEYQNASFYVMSSRNECFPMTLLEAMSCGIPCIAFDCETGPRHIIKHNENGLLAEKENPQKLADAISLLIQNEDLRKKLGENAFHTTHKFSPERIFNKWEKLFLSFTVPEQR
jgi:glycosyltransferase involved in cell wall biosynthesis